MPEDAADAQGNTSDRSEQTVTTHPIPPTRRDDLVETVHGVSVADPYRWLEDGESAETRAWTAAQNARTEALLSAVPGRAALEARLAELLGTGVVGAPAVRGSRLFYTKRTGDQDQSSLRVRDGVDGEERVLVDPNVLGADGLLALDWWFPSHDGALVAYGTSTNGDEWSTLRVVETDTGRVLPDEIPRTRFASVAWLADNTGFYYTRHPAVGSVPPDQENYNRHAFFHPLGADPSLDPKVFGEGRAPEDLIGLTISPDGRWLAATAAEGWARSDLYLRDLHEPDGPFRPVAEGLDARFDLLVPTAERFYLGTNLGAPNYRIVSLDPTDPSGGPESWTTLIPEHPDRVIEAFVLAGDGIVTQELDAATARLRRYRPDGTPVGDIPLPGLGSLTGLDGEPGNPRLGFGYTSYVVPPSAFVHDLDTGDRSPVAPEPPPPGFDPAAYETRQVSYPSKDGTEITMFLTHRAGIALDGTNPTILAGYGGFTIAKTPEFRPAQLAWLERGGLLAIPNLRGGGEYGEDWHRAGMQAKKQNVFDDFLAAAEWLIAANYTRSEKLAIRGGSNGGLLVGAALTQRPELFRAVFCGVPLLDMVRYHRFRIARLWIPEYGSAEDPDAFAWLHAYSPYHRVVDGVSYPATLITCGEQDSRVDPLHARKMTALLQHATSANDDRPILLRAEDKAGHGAGKPLHKRVAEAADEGSFYVLMLGMGEGSL